MADSLTNLEGLSGEVRISSYEIIGAAAAIDGDAGLAAEIDSVLEAMSGPYLFGMNTEARAGIAALQGRREDAVRLLQQAVRDGRPFDNNKHLDFELQPLRGYGPFEVWLKAKG
jgi:hypothetical protein